MNPDEASAKRIGTTLREKWVLERLLGIGGMASVYVGRHKDGRLEAIKILHEEIARSAQLRERFQQEARAVNALRHPGVVEVREVDVTEDGAPFLVMELLEGETLAERVRREPIRDIGEVVRIASEVLDVLDAAHERQIIHRDIKPDNVFLTRSGAVKVLDFGIARVRSAEGRAMTQAGATLGTMAYMPPEQARGLEIDARADLFAVGATIYRLLAGKIVHDATTDAELVMMAMTEPVVPLATVAPSLPATLYDVVDRALAFDRADRYPDARTMKADLQAVARGEAPPYASAAPSNARNHATVAPPAKVVGPPSEKSTAVGVAPEVAPTRHTSVEVPSAAVASAPRIVITPTVVSGGSEAGAATSPTVMVAASAPIPKSLVYAIAAGVGVFLLLGLITLVIVLSTGHRDETDNTSSPATSSSATTATPSPAAAPPPSKHGKGKGKGR